MREPAVETWGAGSLESLTELGLFLTTSSPCSGAEDKTKKNFKARQSHKRAISKTSLPQ